MSEDRLNVSSIVTMGFPAFAEAYLNLVDGLIKRGYDKAPASGLAMDLLVNFMNFTNNNRLADQTGLSFQFDPDTE